MPEGGRGAEVQEQAGVAPAGPEALGELPLVQWVESGRGSEVDQHASLGDEGDAVVPDLRPLVEDGDGGLLFDVQPATRELQGERALVDRLREAVTEFAMHGKERRDDDADHAVLEEAGNAPVGQGLRRDGGGEGEWREHRRG